MHAIAAKVKVPRRCLSLARLKSLSWRVGVMCLSFFKFHLRLLELTAQGWVCEEVKSSDSRIYRGEMWLDTVNGRIFNTAKVDKTKSVAKCGLE